MRRGTHQRCGGIAKGYLGWGVAGFLAVGAGAGGARVFADVEVFVRGHDGEVVDCWVTAVDGDHVVCGVGLAGFERVSCGCEEWQRREDEGWGELHCDGVGECCVEEAVYLKAVRDWEANSNEWNGEDSGSLAFWEQGKCGKGLR